MGSGSGQIIFLEPTNVDYKFLLWKCSCIFLFLFCQIWDLFCTFWPLRGYFRAGVWFKNFFEPTYLDNQLWFFWPFGGTFGVRVRFKNIFETYLCRYKKFFGTYQYRYSAIFLLLIHPNLGPFCRFGPLGAIFGIWVRFNHYFGTYQ